MITKDIETPEIVIEGQSEIRKNSNRFLISVLDQPFDTVPGKNLDLDIGVFGDIGPVIKMEGDVKRIRIG